MAEKVTVQTVDSLQNQTTALTKINSNFTVLANKLDTLLSRDGDTPNQMESNLDMNSYRITNLPQPVQNSEPIRKQDLDAVVSEGIFDGDKGDVVVSSSGTVWAVDNNSISNTKLSDMANATVKGRAVGAGTGDPQDLTPEQARAVIDPQLANFLQAGTDAIVRTIRSKLRDAVSVADFDVVGDGVTDDGPNLQKAIDSLGAAGGTVIIPNTFKCLIDSVDLTIKPNVTLAGPHGFVGSPQDNTMADYAAVGGALIVNSARSIRLKGSATVRGCLVYRKGMAFPSADASAYAGTAFIDEGDDAGLFHCMVIGFNKMRDTINYQRPRYDFVYFDCQSGLLAENCLDNPRIGNIHGWPFGTIATVLKPSNWADRSGVAYHFKNTADWLTLIAPFSYGYFRGTKIENCNSYHLICPSHDGTNAYAGAIGIEIDGTAGGCEEGQILFPRVAAQGSMAMIINTLPAVSTNLVGGALWNCGTHGVLLNGGDLHISDTTIRGIPNGISVNSSSSRVFRKGVRFYNVTNPINVAQPTTTLYGGEDDVAAGIAAGGSIVVTSGSGTAGFPVVASASAVGLPPTGNSFEISGTTNFGTLNGGWVGREVTLIFQSSLSVFSSTGSITAMRLSGGATFNAVAGSTLTLRHNGAQWYEVGRSA